MRAVRIHAPGGPDALVVEEAPYPSAANNDVIVRVHAAGFTPGELGWPAPWKDRAGHDRAPVIPGHEVSGEVAELGPGTTGLTVGQRVFGLTDWARDGTLAEYVGVEARNLAPLPATIDHVHGAALAMPVVRPLVSVAAPPSVQPLGGRATFFVVEPNRDQLAELARRVRPGRITPKVGAVRPLSETRDAFQDRPAGRGKTIVQVA
jgi:NADPH:quinone reductase-like Zn-dependent oxidoreductase